MANGGTNVILAYTTDADAGTLATYLDTARLAGVKVILELPRSDVSGQNITALTDFITGLSQPSRPRRLVYLG